jgi:iron complex transport system substrate-binding protein
VRRLSLKFIRPWAVWGAFFLVGLAFMPGIAEETSASAASPQRIVSLTPGVTETLFALGLGARVVGVSQYCDYPPEAATRPKVGSFLAPVVEAVVAIQPDLVLTSPSPGNRDSVAMLERVGLKVVAVSEGSESVEAVIGSIREVASAVDADPSRLIGSIRAAIAAAGVRVFGLEPVTVAIVVGHDPLVLAGPQSYLGDLAERMGGRNVAHSMVGKWPRVGLEYLVAAAPDVIVDLGMGSEASTGRDRWARFTDVPAVANDRIAFDASLVLLHPGPRLGAQAEILARMLHPQAWQKTEENTSD